MKTKILSILALLLTVTQGAWALDGSGTVGSPYLLQTYDDWTTFVSNVNNGTYATTACAKLMCDIIGTTYRIDKAAYSGTFDGNGHTITRSNTSGAGAMPIFPTVNGATIKNLHVGGSFTFDADNKGALIGMASGTTTVENCRVSAEISYTQTTVNSGCIVGGNEGTLTINGCVFDGNLTVVDGAAELGGIVRSSSTATGRDCVFKPASITGTPSTYCSAIGRGSASLSNSYFFTALSSTNDFNPARSISAGTDVTISGLGDATATYNVSGITAYAAGIKYNGVYYAKNTQTVTLTLSHGDKSGYTFNQYAVAGGGTLTAQTETSATLSMTNANQTINATWTENTATLTDGNDLSALLPYAGKTCTVTYTRSFTADKPSTVCLPFAYTKKTGDGSFYAFSGIEKVGNEYIATMTEPGESTLTANTPYLYKAATTGDANFSGTYAIPASIEAGTTISGNWTFKGTYSTIEWTSAPAEHIYGFSAQDANDGITQGQFVKVGSYVRIKPMRAYLQYNGPDSQFANARALMTRAAATTSDDTLPETIGVRLISANGEVTAIGTLHTRTGEVSFDSEAWYTLDGKRLNAKPNTKGIYVNNGKKVVIK